MERISNGQPHHRVASIPIYLRNVYIYIYYISMFGIVWYCVLMLFTLISPLFAYLLIWFDHYCFFVKSSFVLVIRLPFVGQDVCQNL
jgi:hypothetical protein